MQLSWHSARLSRRDRSLALSLTESESEPAVTMHMSKRSTSYRRPCELQLLEDLGQGASDAPSSNQLERVNGRVVDGGHVAPQPLALLGGEGVVGLRGHDPHREATARVTWGGEGNSEARGRWKFIKSASSVEEPPKKVEPNEHQRAQNPRVHTHLRSSSSRAFPHRCPICSRVTSTTSCPDCASACSRCFRSATSGTDSAQTMALDVPIAIITFVW